MRGGEIAMVFQDPMTSLNPVYTIGRQMDEMLQLHTDLDEPARRAVASACWRTLGFRRRKIGSTPIRTSFPAACVNGS